MHAIGFADLVDVGDVRMIERGSSSRLLIEAAHSIFISSEISGKNLQRDFAVQPRVFRQIYLTHPARAEQRADFIAAQFCSTSKSHLASGSVITSKLRVTTEISFSVLIR